MFVPSLRPSRSCHCRFISLDQVGLDDVSQVFNLSGLDSAPLSILMSSIREQPVVTDEEVVVRSMMSLTIAHTTMDIHTITRLIRELREISATPWILDGHQEPPADWDLAPSEQVV